MPRFYNKQRTTNNKPELMAPAGDWTMLTTAINAGADAIYFGVDKLNMRIKAANFTLKDLPKIARTCKKHEVKSYLTLNSIVYEDEIKDLEKIIERAKKSGINRVICWDFAAAQMCNKHNMPFCISTQASISNSLSAEFFKSLGAVRIVLARECSLDEIKKIRKKTDLEIEAFIHGAMCISVSGRCFLSHHLFGKSANRGECIQPCRREFEVYDSTVDKSLIIGEDYILSPNDLCTIEFIDKLIEAGIDSFKIEGRKRSPEYVAATVSVYRKAIDLYFEGKLTNEKKKEFLTELKTVYNRGFSSVFYFDVPSSEAYADIYGSKATTRKIFIGKVLNYFKTPKAAHIRLESGKVKSGDKLLIIGETTGVVEHLITRMKVNDKESEFAQKSDDITMQIPSVVRKNDKVYLVEEVSG
ncbi:MAG: U32 family peptidase [Ignavibacteriaceae bacterium]|nr:U32 family peptidase [Ignavibacteriaceae bacterium]